LLIVLGVAVGALVVAGPDPALLYGLAALVGFGAIGLWDDVLAVRRNRNLGLRARERLALQGGAGLLLAYLASRQPWAGTVVTPGAGTIDLGNGYVIFIALLFVGFANAVNLADGLDGLAAQLMVVATAGFFVIAVAREFRPAAILAASVGAACTGFLTLNAHPARVFMGDIGSNALGGVLAALAVLTRAEVALFLIGGVFVAEAVSVFLQVAYFKLTHGRRIFRMSPLHHHFELAGWSEPTIVRRFTWAGGLCLVLGLMVALR